MTHKGGCTCNHWQVEVNLYSPLDEMNPRNCDCEYCQANPSGIISDPNMSVAFTGKGYTIRKNGDQLANFYYCDSCGDLLAVGREFDGQLKGAVNTALLAEAKQLGEPIQIQPRLLSADEKLERWSKLWGVLNGL